MRLSELMAGDQAALKHADGQDPNITGLTADSRTVKDGYLFAALSGAKTDGSKYINDAIRLGAAAILAKEGTPKPAAATVPLIPVENPRQRYAQLAARFYGKQPANIAAITGTNGKTSTAVFTEQLWTILGNMSGSIGTLGIRAAGAKIPGSLTTPDPVALHQSLNEMAEIGVTHVAMEASSHGLDQHRLDGVKVTVAAFTNLTRDHLDYHGNFEKYFAAKARLFADLLAENGTAVLNADVPQFKILRSMCEGRGISVMSYGLAADDIKLLEAKPDATGTKLKLAIEKGEYGVHLPLMGSFQVMNALAALGIVIASGADVDDAVAALEKLEGVRGRMELVGKTSFGAPVFVDYAHTPDALETVIKAVRPHAKGRIICVFGAGGDRDTGKRPEMGRVVKENADIAIITDDNPRSEDPAKIRAAIKAACEGAVEIGDRAEAIKRGIGILQRNDILIIAGKGHERGQIVGDTVLPFDDAAVARNILLGGN
ncbi:UDP-N-acetylmuramoyl-L-alanyl-D-glutamate--2,6-diaminopimelate ligase [Thalassospira sp. A3_1]|uniref:UDP-N-acetylmuramoyl-L-alanyl-D-glutamate--2, 6-diaminopimelate ligase n=1 Tax=Thalassospira sp. A3_1 TaxID=2821088 RepID=UPI001AD9B949|nr:UDP-N-acetylmuramoyl-L-alanyl-D-glutamate--2,6-diaminopimelate ligase [Thalassospira sp. A3_1]MBO9506051.1 UDP-N-acetylmuramoyl-L-alanyl-D-glutamate--2,6-diaminopimelate ligase [Thalassospira sp. A3_1]